MISATFKGFSVLCTNFECHAEYTILDDIDGKITEDTIQFCSICGEPLE